MPYPYYLALSAGRLELCQFNKRGAIYVEFLRGKACYRRLHGGGLKQLIARACGIKKSYPPKIVDATAGLGRDAFVLACLGCAVVMLERSPIMVALLQDGLSRLRADPKLAQRLTLALVQAEATEYLLALPPKDRPDVVYLDPLYPSHAKSALAKKEMRILANIVAVAKDPIELLDISLAIAQRRVVVKRAKRLPALGQRQPDICYQGKSTRFDVYLKHTR